MTPSAIHLPARQLRGSLLAASLGVLLGCDALMAESSAEDDAEALYQIEPVTRRTITVAVEAAGVVEPVTTVEVKSKASGEILELPVDIGDDVEAGRLLARIDPRVLDNSLQLAKANLDVARARLANAESSLERVTALYEQASLSKSDWEQKVLDHATAVSEVVRSGIQVENADIALDDADVVSPIDGTVIDRLVEQGQVISSPMGDVGGGTLLMRMADLSHVQVRMLVDEIDIGKVRSGTRAEVNVAAYPNRPFEGEVLKVEPQAVMQQNVTMFPVLIDLENRDGLLRPGMNAEVELLIAHRENVPTIPNAALRTEADIAAAGAVLGHDESAVRAMLAAAPNPQPGEAAGDSAGGSARPGGQGGERPGRERMRAIFAKMRSGEALTEEERRIAARMRERMAQGGPPGAGGIPRRPRVSALDAQFGGDYVVFALRNGEEKLLRVRTGISDMDNVEVIAGLEEDDQVLILPSAFLVRSQESFQRRMSARMGIPGLNRNQGRGRG